ncbi:MAG: hypothetical protein IMW89_17760 [Ktedonobacteraceae bacterium]|nr:hypothetical protein [Ktedonobacteraceae bacterium]
MTADDEENFWIAQANVVLSENGEFEEERVLARSQGEFFLESSDNIVGRVKTYEAIVKGENIMEPGVQADLRTGAQAGPLG